MTWFTSRFTDRKVKAEVGQKEKPYDAPKPKPITKPPKPKRTARSEKPAE